MLLIESFTEHTSVDQEILFLRAMNIDFEMESRGCSFEYCNGNMNVPVENPRIVIPWQYYDDFGLLNETERNSIWAVGKPQTEEEANMLLHKARLNKNAVLLNDIMTPNKYD